jgi:hypothetical protein
VNCLSSIRLGVGIKSRRWDGWRSWAGQRGLGGAGWGSIFAWEVAVWSGQQPLEVWEIFGFRPFCKILCLGNYPVKFDVWDIIWCSQTYFVICDNLICHLFIYWWAKTSMSLPQPYGRHSQHHIVHAR